MLFERLAQHGTEIIVVIERFDLWNNSEFLKCLVVKFVCEREMRIRHHHIRQFLDIPQTVRNPSRLDTSKYLNADKPGRQLGAHIIGRADQSRLGQSASKKGQLAETDGPDLTRHPAKRD